jgi:adenylosuccinate lyase
MSPSQIAKLGLIDRARQQISEAETHQEVIKCLKIIASTAEQLAEDVALDRDIGHYVGLDNR